MISYILGSIFFAWVLSFFDFDEIFTKGFYELFKVRITIAGYYMMFFLVGFIFGLFNLLLEV